MELFETSSLLAADLAGAQIDPNEAQKALAYLRTKKDAKQFFEYLRAINKDGRAVIRSGQTLGYYRDLLVACERHLRGMQADEMAQTLGWAIRLLRYYRVVPDAAELLREQAASPRVQAFAEPSKAAEPVKAAEQLPAVGDTFVGKIIAVDESAVLITIPGFTEDKAVGVMQAATIPGGRTERYREGNMARVEVMGLRTLKNGRVIVELKPGAKK
jgi:hypothetical protein